MRELTEQLFRKNLSIMFKNKPDLIKFFERHERKDLLIANLAKELWGLTIEYPGTKKEHIEEIVSDFTRSFCRNALKYEEERHMTSLQREMTIKKAQKIDPDFEVMEIDRSHSYEEIQEKINTSEN